MNDDRELRRALHEMILDVMDTGGGPPEEAAEAVCEVYPDLRAMYGTDRILRLAMRIFGAELPLLSRAYTALFAHFNRRYFDGRLPRYGVRVFYNVESVDGTGCICASTNLIRLRVTRDERWMISNLLQLMADISADSNEDQLSKEMERLRNIGAPAAAETEPGTWIHPSEIRCAEASELVRRIVTAGPVGEEMSQFD